MLIKRLRGSGWGVQMSVATYNFGHLSVLSQVLGHFPLVSYMTVNN